MNEREREVGSKASVTVYSSVDMCIGSCRHHRHMVVCILLHSVPNISIKFKMVIHPFLAKISRNPCSVVELMHCWYQCPHGPQIGGYTDSGKESCVRSLITTFMVQGTERTPQP